MAEGLMAGKRGLIMGVANNRSIAWGIARALAGQGAEIAFSYQGEALKKRVEPLAAEIGVTTLVECDVASDAAMDETFRVLEDKWGTMDFLVHAIGFSNKEELEGRYIDTSADNFALTMNISVYSFTIVAKRAEPMLNPALPVTITAPRSTCRTTTSWASLGRARSLGALPARPRPRTPRQRHLRRRHQELAASGISGLRTMLLPEDRATPAQRHAGGSGYRRALPPQRSRLGRPGRSVCRLQHHRHACRRGSRTLAIG